MFHNAKTRKLFIGKLPKVFISPEKVVINKESLLYLQLYYGNVLKRNRVYGVNELNEIISEK